jgi:hypothetical protein
MDTINRQVIKHQKFYTMRINGMTLTKVETNGYAINKLDDVPVSPYAKVESVTVGLDPAQKPYKIYQMIGIQKIIEALPDSVKYEVIEHDKWLIAEKAEKVIDIRRAEGYGISAHSCPIE